VILITGAAGKTTTKDLTVTALRGSTRVLSSLKNHNSNRAALRRLLKLGPRYGAGVFEVGTRQEKDVRRIAEIARPTISYTTSIGPSHLDSFGNIQAVLRAETEQYDNMIASNSPVQVLANIDDPLLRKYCLKLKAKLPRDSRMYTVSVDGPADILARKVKFLFERDVMRTHFVAHTPWGRQEINIPLIGLHNVRNALAAISLGMLTGLTDLERIAGNLDVPHIAANRSKFFRSKHGFFVLDDSYNSNPLSMKAAFDTLVEIQENISRFKKIIAVVSDMNELAELAGRYHFQAGVQARNAGVSELIVGGKYGANWESGFGRPVHRFKGISLALQQMLGCAEGNPEDVLFLIKASHGTGLHKLSQRLMEPVIS
jgi:UDP-N-acetylmuramoyl-tripeptide--D-alanyl-D-alanine ligase